MATPTLTDSRVGANGRLRTVPVRHAWNIPWIVVGVLLVAVSALAFAVLGGGESGSLRLALAHDIRAGQPLTEADLVTVRVSGGRVNALPSGDRSAAVGRVAVANLSAGTLLSDDLLAAGPLVDAGSALVGVPLDSFSTPVPSLQKGDAVMVVRTPSATAATPDNPRPAVWRATVFAASSAPAAEASGAGEVVVVSLMVDARDAPGIAAAAATDQVRLVLVRSLDDVPPELLFSDVIGGAPAVDETDADETDADETDETATP